MEKVFYFILIFCGILSQGICNLYQENNAEESSDILIRQKRITGGIRRTFEHAPHLVALLVNGNFHCPSTLLTTDVAITSAQCVKDQNQRMMSIQSRTSVGDHPHQIVRVIFLDTNYDSSRPTVNNLALVEFAPAISLSFSRNHPIRLYNGSLSGQDLRFEVVNWGRPLCLGPNKIPPIYLRSITMRLISIEYCQSVYPSIIGRGNLCAYAERSGEYCQDKDTGAPLFVEGQLLGIMVFHGHVHHTNPDVFMNLLDHNIRNWIYGHVPSLR